MTIAAYLLLAYWALCWVEVGFAMAEAKLSRLQFELEHLEASKRR